MLELFSSNIIQKSNLQLLMMMMMMWNFFGSIFNEKVAVVVQIILES